VVGFFVIAAIGAAGLTALGVAPRAERQAELATTARAVADARRLVTVASPTREGAAYELRLPASTAPLQATVLHARTDGYIKTLRADIGDRVKAGQVLAEIESRETDAELDEARATLAKNRADLELATLRLNRVKTMYEQQAASRGEYDDLVAQHNAATAAVGVGEAVVTRLETEQSFQKVVAPFDGIVTQRNVEVGSLVSSGSAAGVTPLFRIEQNDVLKVYVDAPQSAAPSVAVGQSVQVEVREFPGRRFEGKVVRTAGSVDPTSRTLRTEIHLPNLDGALLAGVYGQVHLGVRDPRNPVRIPAAALVVDAAGPQVVTVAADNTARRHPDTLGRDIGRDLEVTGGLNGDERLVVNPRDDLRDGDVVDVR
jgi:membrane fusion protein, multidrug efflux system